MIHCKMITVQLILLLIALLLTVGAALRKVQTWVPLLFVEVALLVGAALPLLKQ